MKTPPASSPALRPQILAVDDAKAVRIIAQRALAPFACEVVEATNGFLALFAMERVLPDLILLDVSMPTMGGLEMLEMLKSKPALAVIPVIMMTSTSDRNIHAQLAALGGVAGTIQKPFSEAALAAAVTAVLPLKPNAPSAGDASSNTSPPAALRSKTKRKPN